MRMPDACISDTHLWPRRLKDGPSAVCSFNLANVFYGLRRKVEAANYFQLAVQLDPYWHEAWNNLGVVLCELRECDQAMTHCNAPYHWRRVGAIRFSIWPTVATARAHGPVATLLAVPALDADSEWGRYAGPIGLLTRGRAAMHSAQGDTISVGTQSGSPAADSCLIA